MFVSAETTDFFSPLASLNVEDYEMNHAMQPQ